MKKFLKTLGIIALAGIILFTSVRFPSSEAYAASRTPAPFTVFPTDKISGTFYFPQDIDRPTTFIYRDDFFANESTTYHHSLATFALCLAMSAFESKNVGYSYGYKNTEDLMKKVGCIDIEANEDFKKKPETDTMGVCIGRKEIELTDGTTQPVMMVALRGGNYASEWTGNVRVGTRGEHLGFSYARDAAIQSIVDYMEAHGDDFSTEHPVKILVAGYSRASATANLTGAYLNCAVLGEDGRSDLKACLDKAGTTLQDIYVYGFEVPQGYTNNSEYQPSDTSNLFCIVNPIDPVPYVAPSKLGGFKHAGTEIDPTYGITESAFYAQLGQVDSSMIQKWKNKKALHEFTVKESSLLGIILSFFSSPDFDDASDTAFGDTLADFDYSLMNDYLVDSLKMMEKFLDGYDDVPEENLARSIYSNELEDSLTILVGAYMGLGKDDSERFVSALAGAAGKQLDFYTISSLISNIFKIYFGTDAGYTATRILDHVIRGVVEELEKNRKISDILSDYDLNVIERNSYSLARFVTCLYLVGMRDDYQHLATGLTYGADLFEPHYPEYTLAFMRAGDYLYQTMQGQYQLTVSSRNGESLDNIEVRVKRKDTTSPYEETVIATVDKDGLSVLDGYYYVGNAWIDEGRFYITANLDGSWNQTDLLFEIVCKEDTGCRQGIKTEYTFFNQGTANQTVSQDFERSFMNAAYDDVIRLVPDKNNRSLAVLEKTIKLTPVFVNEKYEEISGGTIKVTADGKKASLDALSVFARNEFEITPPEGTYLKQLEIPYYGIDGNPVENEKTGRYYTVYQELFTDWDQYYSSMPLYIICSGKQTEGKVYADVLYQHEKSSSSSILINDEDKTAVVILDNLTKGSSSSGPGAKAIDAEPGDKVSITIKEGDLVAGKEFRGWTINGSNISEKTEDGYKLTFTMPEGGVEIHAVFGDKTDLVTLTFTGSWASPNGTAPSEQTPAWKQIYIDPEYADIAFKKASNFYPVKHIYEKRSKDAGRAWIKAPSYPSEISDDGVFDHWEVYYTDTGKKFDQYIAVETSYNPSTGKYEKDYVKADGFKGETIVLEKIKDSITLVPVYTKAKYTLTVRNTARGVHEYQLSEGETITIKDAKVRGLSHTYWDGYYYPLAETMDAYGNVTRGLSEDASTLPEYYSTTGDYLFTMPKGDAYLTAHSEDTEYEVSWTGDAIKTNSGDTVFNYRDEVNILPDNLTRGTRLVDIKIVSGEDPDETNPEVLKAPNGDVISLTFTMPDSDVVLAPVTETVQHILTVENAVADYPDGGEITDQHDGTYNVFLKDFIRLTPVIPDGKYFVKWEVSGIDEDDLTIYEDDAHTAFIEMPDADITVKAVLGNLKKITDISAEFTSTFAGAKLMPTSASVNGEGVKETSVETPHEEMWLDNPAIFGYPYEFSFVLNPEVGYYFAEDSKITLNGEECSVTVMDDGSALAECTLRTGPAYITDVNDVPDVIGIESGHTVPEIKAMVRQSTWIFVDDGHSYPVDISWDWDGLAGYDPNEKTVSQEFTVEGQIDTAYLTEDDILGFYSDEYLLYADGVSKNINVKISTVPEDETAAPYVTGDLPGKYDNTAIPSLNCVTEGAKIYYIINDGTTEPSAAEIISDGSEYSDETPIELKGTTGETKEYSLWAAAIKGEKASEAVRFDYTIEMPDLTEYTLTVVNGIGSGSYRHDDTAVVGIRANDPEENTSYTGFTADNDVTFISGGLNDNYASFHMPANNLKFVANFTVDVADFILENPSAAQDLPGDVEILKGTPENVEVEGTPGSCIKYTDVTDVGNPFDASGKADYSRIYRGEFTIDAAGEGFSFADDVKITVNGEEKTADDIRKNDDGSITVFHTFSETEAKTFMLTVINGKAVYADSGKDIPSGTNIPVGTSVQVIADEKDGYRFSGWSESNGVISPEGEEAGFIMPESDVTLTAEYEKVISRLTAVLEVPEAPGWTLSGKAQSDDQGIKESEPPVSWTFDGKDVTEAKENGVYCAQMIIHADDGFIFDEKMTAELNGRPCEVTVSADGKTATLCALFDAQPQPEEETSEEETSEEETTGGEETSGGEEETSGGEETTGGEEPSGEAESETDEVNTGDHNGLPLYPVLILLSGGLIVFLLRRRKN